MNINVILKNKSLFLLTTAVLTLMPIIVLADTGIRWNQSIYPDEALTAYKVRDFKALLSTPWKEPIPVYVKVNEHSNEQRMRIESCNQLLRMENKLYRTDDPTDWPPLMDTVLRCKAMSIMADMKKPKASYFTMSAQKLVPDLAELHPSSSDDEIRLFFSGLKQKIVEKKCFTKNICRVRTKQDVYMLNLVGAGDYNSDGFDDEVLIVSSSPIGGTATSGLSLGFVISRTNPNGKLEILKIFESGR